MGNSFSGKIYGKVNLQRENKTGEGVISFFVGQLNTSNKQLTSSRSYCYVTGVALKNKGVHTCGGEKVCHDG